MKLKPYQFVIYITKPEFPGVFKLFSAVLFGVCKFEYVLLTEPVYDVKARLIYSHRIG